MKNLSFLLLIIGSLGTIAAIYGMINSGDVLGQFPFLVCGLSLIWGYTEERKKETQAKN